MRDLPLIATFDQPVTEHGELPEPLDVVPFESDQRFAKNHYGCSP
jgi:hypothetical protein